MITRKGWAEQLMIGFFAKEATYDAGVTMNNTNACSLRGFEVSVDWPDVVVNDKDTVTGFEHGTDQEILEKRVAITITEKRARPNTIAGLLALAMGAPTSTQDAGLTAYRHQFSPVALGSALPSTRAEHQKGTVQYGYNGLKCNSLEISGEAGGFVSVTAELMGSGTRAISATAMANYVAESYVRMNTCKVWMESGASISIASPLVQDVQNISSGTPTDLKTRALGFKWKMSNNLEGQPGFNGLGVYQDMDVKRRQFELSFDLLFNTSTELDLFLNQTPVAFEVDSFGAVIAGGGTYKYGLNLAVPRFKISKAPHPQGGPDDFLKCTIECDVQSDLTNPGSKAIVNTAKSVYLA